MPSRRLALLYILALGVLLGLVLLSQSARVPLRTPFVPRAARAAPLTVALERRDALRGGSIFRLELAARDVARLWDHEELQLFLESAEPQQELTRARLELRGTQCVFVAPGRDRIDSRRPTVFHRAGECLGLADRAAPAALVLVVETRGRCSLALLGFTQTDGAEPAPLQVTPARARGTLVDVRGAFVDYPKTAPRIVLLNHMWRAPGIGWLAGLLAFAISLACVGCFVFPTRPLALDALLPSPLVVLRGACGAALFAASLTLLHALLEPPLSGPDEPYHLLGFADLVKDEALAKDTVAWMGETHLWRIRQQPSERFRTIDVGRPYVVEDDQLHPTEVAMRSAVLARLWRGVAPHLRGRSAPTTLMALRVVNVLLFSLAVAVATAVALMLVSEPYPQWLVFPFLFVPSLPFFAMHVSETAILCAVYVLLGSSLGVISLDGVRAHWAGPPLGLATGLMLAGGRSPWPLSVCLGFVLLGRLLLGSRGRGGIRVALVFWGGFALGASVFFLTLDNAYRMMTEGYASYYTRHIPAGLRGLGLWLLAHPLAATGLLLAGAALEATISPLRAWLGTLFEAPARRVVAKAATALAFGVLLSLVGSLFLHYPQLPLEPEQPLTAAARVIAVLETMGTAFRLTEPNFLLASSFWVGFGWLDTVPKPAFQALLVGLSGAAVITLLRYIARYQQVRRFIWLLVVAAGATAALVLYTLSTQDLIAALQGRYLIGWYLAVLGVIGGALVLDSEAARTNADLDGRRGAVRAALLLAVSGAVHVYCLSFILQRYF